MSTKAWLTILTIICAFLSFRIYHLESEINQLHRNTAIAVLSAEIANKKIGAVAPYFQEDKDAFANAWIDDSNMPGAIFPEKIIVPLKDELARRRSEPASQKIKAETFQ